MTEAEYLKCNDISQDKLRVNCKPRLRANELFDLLHPQIYVSKVLANF